MQLLTFDNFVTKENKREQFALLPPGDYYARLLTYYQV